MQRVFRVFGIVVMLALFASAAGAQQPARSYILLGKSDKLPVNLEQVVDERGGSVAYTVPEIGLAVLTSANPDFQAQMEAVADVESVAPDIKIQYEMPGFEPLSMPQSSGSPFDFAQYQWNLDAIDAPEAWATGARGAGVRIAVVDDGIFPFHPDIAPNLNTALSASFIPNDPSPFTPADFPSHASYVAGIAAASDNGIGVIGVAPEAEIVGVRVLTWQMGANGPESVGKFSWLASGIVYAANIESDVINVSLGGWLDKDGFCTDEGCYSKKEAGELKKMLDRATRYAHKQGAVVIAAAGNDSVNGDSDRRRYFLPAQSDKVIAVSATGPINWITDPNTELDLFAPYSNFGKSIVSFAAPGGNPSLQFIDPGCIAPFPLFGVLNCFFFDNVWGPSSSPFFPWTVASGTSAAAPHVSGVAALIIGQNDGPMNPEQVALALRKGADDLGAAGKDAYFGDGRVNAAASLEWFASKSKAKTVELGEAKGAESAACDDALACPTADQNVLFLGLIVNGQ